MITIKATSFNGHRLAEPLFADFDTAGGSIGRKDDNTLVLPDPQQLISRIQAVVEFRSGAFVIRDEGKTPIMINRKPLGNGHEARISDGDEICIGGYVLMVTETVPSTIQRDSTAGDENPFADFLTPVSQSSSSLPQFSQVQLQDPQFANDDPFAKMFSKHAAPASNAPKPTPNVANNAAYSGIPDDFDPFADLMQGTAQSGRLQLPDDIGLGLGISDGIDSGQSIDALFGLDGSQAAVSASDVNFLNDSLCGSLGIPSDSSLDPLAAFGVPATRHSNFKDTQRNDTPELHGSMRLPEAKAAQHMDRPGENTTGQNPGVNETIIGVPEQHNAAMNSASRAPEPYALFGAAAPDKAKPLVSDPVIPELQSAVPSSRTSSYGSLDAPPIRAREQPDTTTEAADNPQQKNQTAAHVSLTQRDELLQALLEGAGMSDLQLPGGLTPQLMNLIGKLLRESTQGTLDLLLARALMKREMRADVTIIVMQENNPLKFSPTVEAALSHLLAPQGRGFLTPLRAVKGAYNDLRSHQLGFMAGMQAALSGVLARFNPERLERRLQEKSVLNAFLSMNRRARLWDLFSEFYADISKEAEDDFHALFGKEFLRAYEQQIAKLEKEDRESSR